MQLQKTMLVKDLAHRFGAEIIGDPNYEIKSINELRKVDECSLTYVDNPKHYDRVLQSCAPVILIDRPVKTAEEKTLLVVDDPFFVYNEIAKEVRPFIPSSSSVSDSAKIGEGTIVQPNVFIGNHVSIGKNCIIHPHVTIYDYTEIGDNVVIHANTTVGSDAFYYHEEKSGRLEKMHSTGKVIIKDNVEIGAGSTIDCGVSGITQIGNGTKLDNQVHIGYGTIIGNNCLLAAQVAIAGKTYIGDNVKLYGKVGVNEDITIGKNAIVLAASNVSKSLAGNKTYFGTPAIEAKEKWKEMVYLRMLPKAWKKILFKEPIQPIPRRKEEDTLSESTDQLY